jgi:hypothetical protein
MKVVWEGTVVASRNFVPGNTTSSDMGWANEHVLVTATERASTLIFQDTTPGNEGTEIGAATLTPASEVVNGFMVTNSTGVYATTLRQMLTKIPGSVLVPNPKKPVCSLRAGSAAQVHKGTGVLILWAISPTARFIRQPSAAQLASAKVVKAYLVGLLNRSRALYASSLRASRLPPQGNSWWGVEVQSTSTSGSPMSLEVALAGTKTTFTWSNVPEVSSTAPSLAVQALANLLYYTKNIASV